MSRTATLEAVGATPLLEIEDLRVDFTGNAGGDTPAVRGLALTVHAGEIVALVGESGSGKSVTAAAVLGLLPARGARASGRVRFEGRELLGLHETALNEVRGQGIGIVFQNSVTSLDPSLRIGVQLQACAAHRRRLDRAEAQALALRWLERVGIRDAARVMRAYPHELSGGMRQRVMIAIAAMARPRLLIADEPTTALDATIQKQILDLLLAINREEGTAMLVITHDFGVVSYLAERVAVMRAGALVEQGPTARILAAPAHDYTRRLIRAVPQLGARAGDRTHRRRLGRNTEPPEPAAPAAQPPAANDEAPVLVEAEHVARSFVTERSLFRRQGQVVHAVRDASLLLRRGEILGLIGESGSGKSTLARTIAQLLPVTAGQLRFDGRDAAHFDAAALRALRRRLQFVFQDSGSALNPRRTVAAQLVEPALRLGVAATRDEALGLAAEMLARVGLEASHLQRHPHAFSGGQRQRIGIARALMVRPEVLVLDEPTSALDVSIQAQVLDLLLDLREQLGLSYILIGHNLPVIEFMCDRVAVMDQGRIVETLDASDLRAHARHPVTRGLLDAVLPIGATSAAAAPLQRSA